MPTTRPVRVLATTVLAAGAALVVSAAPAGACGGLVGENGTIQLTKTTHAGRLPRRRRALRHQLRVHRRGRGGRLDHPAARRPHRGDPGRRLDPPAPRPGGGTRRRGGRCLPGHRRCAQPPASAEVLLETKIDALDITVLKGGGDEVGRWARDNGFLLTPDAPEMLDFYGRRSEIFMAARFDASRAAELGQAAGDGTPIMLTIPTDQPWVPLRILSLGLEESEFVEADVFLLTDEQPSLLAGGPGLTLARSEAAERPPPQRSPVRRRHGVGARRDVVHLPPGGHRGRRARLRPRHLGRPDHAPDHHRHRRRGRRGAARARRRPERSRSGRSPPAGSSA